MKKFIQIVTATILSAGFIGSIASASVEACNTNAEVHNSGNGNTTVVSCTSEKTATIRCENNIIVGNYNIQGGTSGDATNSGNESGGSVASGTVVNYNNTDTTIGASCVTVATTTTPTPSVTPVTPGKGAVTPAAASLPNTASNNVVTIIGVSLASAAAVVGLSRAGLAVYRRASNK
jgi:hypothetical protein